MDIKKSYVEQSIERLYGPGALGIGFKTRRSMIEQERNSPIRENASTDEPKTLPQVFKHLRPEFRSQLVSKSGLSNESSSPNNSPVKSLLAHNESKSLTNSPVRSVKCKELEGPVVRHIPITLEDEKEESVKSGNESNVSKKYSSPLKTFTLGTNSTTTVLSHLGHGYNLRSNASNKYSSINQPKPYSQAINSLKKTPQSKEANGTEYSNLETPKLLKNLLNNSSSVLQNVNGTLKENESTYPNAMVSKLSNGSSGIKNINHKVVLQSPLVKESSNLDSFVKSEGTVLNTSNTVNISKDHNGTVVNGTTKTNGVSIENLNINKDENDGHYYLKIAEAETEFLDKQATIIEDDIKSNDSKLSEDLKGRLLATVGKIRLLKSQKIKQFIGLCQKNINGSLTDEFPTTVEDLAGFWDMVSIQIDSVKGLISEWQKLKSNDYKEETKKISNKVVPKFTSKAKTSCTMNAEQKKKAEERKKVQDERRKALKEAMMAKRKQAEEAKENNDIVIFAGIKQ